MRPGADFQFNITHATTFVLNKHTVKVGLYWDRARDIEGRVGIVNGQFDFGLTPNNPLNSGNIFANQLLGNFIGANAAGTVGLGNAGDGVFVTGGASSNTIGGTVAGAGNVISANGGFAGVEINRGNANAVRGNIRRY